LPHQRRAVGKEQYPLDPISPHQQVGQGDDRAGLAGAGRHHQQRLALPVALEGLRHPADGAVLVGSLHDLGVDVLGSERLARRATLN